MDKKPIVINLIGGPGVGKSTIASGLFYELKRMGVNCELALEFAKDKVYEESFKTMDDQIYIFAKQYHKLWRLRDKVDVIITDSPLLISLHYMKEDSKYFNDLVVEQYFKFENLLFFINRTEDGYQTEGRLQTLDEAKTIDKSIKEILARRSEEISSYDIDRDTAIRTIMNILELTYPNILKKNAEFDGRIFTEEKIGWSEINVGDIVLEGDEDYQYRTLTGIKGTYWCYFENGYYHSTSPEYCHWLVRGQKGCDGKLIRIV